MLLVRNRQRFLLVAVVYSINNTSSYVQVLTVDFLSGDTRFTQTIYTQKSAWNSQTNFPWMFNQWECGDFNQWERDLTSQWKRYRGHKTTNELDCICLNTWAMSWIGRGNYCILSVANVTKNKFFSIDTNSLTLITF